jgi:hypothetical protein
VDTIATVIPPIIATIGIMKGDTQLNGKSMRPPGKCPTEHLRPAAAANCFKPPLKHSSLSAALTCIG